MELPNVLILKGKFLKDFLEYNKKELSAEEKKY